MPAPDGRTMNFSIKKPWVNQRHNSPFNRELNKKKQAIIQNLTDNPDGIHIEETKAGTVVFDHGTAVLPNDGRANDIYWELRSREKHRAHYNLVTQREGFKRDPTHKYRIMNPALPWNTYDELGRKVSK